MEIRFALIILLVIGILDILWGIRKKRGKFTFKRFINNWSTLLFMVWTAFFIVWGALQLPDVITWSKLQVLRSGGTATSQGFVMSLAPIFVLLTIYYVAYKALRKAFTPLWGYTEEETGYIKEGNRKLKESIRNIFRRLKSVRKARP